MVFCVKLKVSINRGSGVKDNQKVNVNSLILIREELISTIEQAANALEEYLGDKDNKDPLEQCITLLTQIRGCLDLIQLFGAVDLAGEILTAVRGLSSDTEHYTDEQLAEVSRSFFILSRYFEYALQCQQGMPTLLVPYINEIRKSFRKPLLPESHYFSVRLVYHNHNDSTPDEPLVDLVKRLRHMYQLGLLGLLRQTGIKPSLGLMQRALIRLSRSITGDNTLFWTAYGALLAFEQNSYELTLTRKRAFSALDRQFKQLLTSTEINADDLLKELVYLNAIAASDDKHIQAVKTAFEIEDHNFTELDLQRQHHALTGPSANTVNSVVTTLQEELREVKEIIESASMSDTSSINNFDELISKMANIKDILDLVGLKPASETMKQQVDKLTQLKRDSEVADSVELIEIADAFLYIDSTLKGLDKLDFTSDKIVEINKITRREMIMASNLAEAKQVVIEEIESGLALVKRALGAFNDSEYDRAHIRNVPSTLNSIRGGMTVLEKPRASAIVTSCQMFIEESLLPTSQPAALAQMLETFADALIGLEYYLDCVKIDNNVDDEILAIAEESLAALGYGVSHT